MEYVHMGGLFDFLLLAGIGALFGVFLLLFEQHSGLLGHRILSVLVVVVKGLYSMHVC